MNNEEIFNMLKEILSREVGLKSEITLNTALIGEGLADSLEFMSYLTEVETRLKITIPNEDVESFKLGIVKNMVEYLSNKIKSR